VEILLVSKKHGHLGRLRLGLFSLSILLLGMLAFGLGTAYLGFSYGIEQMTLVMLDSNDNDRAALQRELLEQRVLVARSKEDAEMGLDALARRVGRLQAHMMRLDAVGQRLIASTGLPADEFDFAHDPAQGGPEWSYGDTVTIKDFIADLSQLDVYLKEREGLFTGVEALLHGHQLQKQLSPSGRPLLSGWLSSAFGRRTDPITGKQDFHPGMDFAGKRGDPVVAVASGIVTWSGKRHGYGNVIEIKHGNGYQTRYAHNQQNLVRVADKVTKGQIIARLGSTGRSTGPHVHFEVMHEGKIINPKQFISRLDK